MVNFVQRAAVALLLVLAQFGAAAAEDPYPAKQVTLMVPYPAGALSDVMARVVAESLSKELKQTVIVENLGGVSGALAAQKVLSAPADGYYILQGSPNELILSPLANSAVKFKPSDFRLVQMLANVPLMIVTRGDLEANTPDEFVNLARQSRGDKSLKFGSVGAGSLYHVLGEHLAKALDAEMLHVPYKGGAPMLQDLVGGRVDFALVPLSSQWAGLAEQGRIKILGTLWPERLATLPKIPSVSEGHAMRKFNFAIWTGYFVREGTPAPIVDKLNAALAKVMQEPGVRTQLTAQNVIPPERAQSTRELAAIYASETTVFRTIASGVKMGQP